MIEHSQFPSQTFLLPPYHQRICKVSRSLQALFDVFFPVELMPSNKKTSQVCRYTCSMIIQTKQPSSVKPFLMVNEFFTVMIWDSAKCTTYSADYFYQQLTLESWLTNLEQMPLNHSQQLQALYKQLIDGLKQNWQQLTEQPTNWLTINNRLTVTKDGSKDTTDIWSFLSQ